MSPYRTPGEAPASPAQPSRLAKVRAWLGRAVHFVAIHAVILFFDVLIMVVAILAFTSPFWPALLSRLRCIGDETRAPNLQPGDANIHHGAPLSLQPGEKGHV